MIDTKDGAGQKGDHKMSPISKETLETVVSFCEFSGVALGLIAAFLLFISVMVNRPLKQIIAEETRKERLAEEGARMTMQTNLTTLQTFASDAKTAQQQVEIELAKQKSRAAIAERALLELQERIKPRRLSAKPSEDFVNALKVLPNGTIDFGYTAGGCDESLIFAQQLLPLFKEAGWTVRNEASIANHLEIQVIGIGIVTSGPLGPNPEKPPAAYIKLTPTLETLRAAFRAVGIEVQFINWFPGKDTPEVVVGSKPQP